METKSNYTDGYQARGFFPDLCSDDFLKRNELLSRLESCDESNLKLPGGEENPENKHLWGNWFSPWYKPWFSWGSFAGNLQEEIKEENKDNELAVILPGLTENISNS